MPEPSSAFYDFAVFTFADALERLPDLLQALKDRFGPDRFYFLRRQAPGQ